jgi:hypothetical protein
LAKAISLLLPLAKGGWEGFSKPMLSYDKQLKALSQCGRNMELFIIYKISPLPSPKRLRAGRSPLFALRARGPMGRRPKKGKKERTLLKRGEEKRQR